MPRDATLTRSRLQRQAERLFAERGVYQVTVREITVAAGQRNPSVVHYHFASMDGLRQVILDTHEAPLDTLRGQMLAKVGERATTRDLVSALLVPYATSLQSESGRDFLRIVNQLSSGFSAWERQAAVSPHLVRILRLLRDRHRDQPSAARNERIVAVIVLISGLFAERATTTQRRRGVRSPDDAFISNMADMIVAMLEAPTGPILTA